MGTPSLPDIVAAFWRRLLRKSAVLVFKACIPLQTSNRPEIFGFYILSIMRFLGVASNPLRMRA